MSYSGVGVAEAYSASPMIPATSTKAAVGPRRRDVKLPYIWKYRCSILRQRMAIPVRDIRHPAAAELDLATILRTVGDPVRLAIVRELADDRERTCTALQDALGLPASTGSYHLR